MKIPVLLAIAAAITALPMTVEAQRDSRASTEREEQRPSRAYPANGPLGYDLDGYADDRVTGPGRPWRNGYEGHAPYPYNDDVRVAYPEPEYRAPPPRALRRHREVRQDYYAPDVRYDYPGDRYDYGAGGHYYAAPGATTVVIYPGVSTVTTTTEYIDEAPRYAVAAKRMLRPRAKRGWKAKPRCVCR